MKKAIFIAGYCATGKSTFAKKLSRQFMMPLFSKDTLKENLADSIGSINKNVIDKLSLTTFNLMYFISEINMKTNQTFILESNFKPNEANKLNDLIKKYSYESLTFLFIADPEITYERYKKRDNDGERHWVHRTFKETRDDFMNGNLALGKINLGSNIITIDATSFEKIDYDKLYDLASDFLRY